MDETFLRSLGLIVVAAGAFSLLGRFALVPAIVLYIFAGIALGPVTGLVEVDEPLHLIAELGIALLLFLVGLELSFARIKDVGKVALAAGIGQVLFTAAGGFVICAILGFSVMESIFLATALTFSSTVVVVKLLDQKGELNTLYGRIAVGIFLVQDLVVIVILTLLAGLSAEGGNGWAEVAWGIVKAFIGMGVLLGGVLLASRHLLPKPFGWAARSPDLLFIWALGWCFLIVAAAEWMDLSLEVGAFLAGISLAQLPYADDLRRRVHPLMNFFIAVFFVSLGIQMNFGETAHFWQAGVLSLFVLIGNPLIFILIIVKMGYAEKTAFKTSVTVAQISEFSFIFAAMGVTAGLIGTDILGVTALVGVVTIAVSAYMILYSDKLYAGAKKFGLLRPFRAREEDPPPPEDDSPKPVIVIGMNALGRELAARLCEAGERVVAVDTDPNKLTGLRAETLVGNVETSGVLEEADWHRAKCVISALQIEETNEYLAYLCKEAGISCCVHAFDLSLVANLLDLDVRYLLTPKADGLLVQLREMKEKGVLPET